MKHNINAKKLTKPKVREPWTKEHRARYEATIAKRRERDGSRAPRMPRIPTDRTRNQKISCARCTAFVKSSVCELTGEIKGECRLHPPVMGIGRSVFPTVAGECYCRQFAAK